MSEDPRTPPRVGVASLEGAVPALPDAVKRGVKREAVARQSARLQHPKRASRVDRGPAHAR